MRRIPDSLFSDQKICILACPFVEIMQYTIILESDAGGGFLARCIEIPGAVCHGETQNDAFSCMKSMIESIVNARNEELERIIASPNSEIFRIEVADSA